MTDDMTTTIEVDGIQIEIRRRGMGRPLLVIHGWSADHRYMMADLEPNFDNDDSSSTTTTTTTTWQRIYFDLPGHGTTIAPDWLTNQTQMFEIVIKVIDIYGHWQS